MTPNPTPQHPVARPWYRDRRIQAWSLFDFANTPFAVLVLTVAFPTFFKEVVLEGSRAGDFLWGLAGSLSMAVVALSAPFMGAYADAARIKRRLLLAYTLFTVTATALLGLAGPGTVVWAMVVFILANIGYQGSQVFYNAFLMEIAGPEIRGRVSGLGIGAGYLAALIGLAVALPFYGSTGSTPASLSWLFLFVAAFYLMFSLPALRVLRDSRPAVRPNAPDDPVTPKAVLSRLAETSRHLRANRGPFRFLLSYLVYMEAIATMTAFTAIYARDTLDLPMSRILVLFMFSQLTAIPGSYLLGRLADRVGSKTAVALSLFLWVTIVGLAAAASGFGLILAVALLAGAATGGLQTVSRSFMAELTPAGREGEYFGFYAVVGRFSAVLGPVTFGAVSSASGSQRLALVLLAGLLVVALLLLRDVPGRLPQAPREPARPAAPPSAPGSATPTATEEACA